MNTKQLIRLWQEAKYEEHKKYYPNSKICDYLMSDDLYCLVKAIAPYLNNIEKNKEAISPKYYRLHLVECNKDAFCKSIIVYGLIDYNHDLNQYLGKIVNNYEVINYSEITFDEFHKFTDDYDDDILIGKFDLEEYLKIKENNIWFYYRLTFLSYNKITKHFRWIKSNKNIYDKLKNKIRYYYSVGRLISIDIASKQHYDHALLTTRTMDIDYLGLNIV